MIYRKSGGYSIPRRYTGLVIVDRGPRFKNYPFVDACINGVEENTWFVLNSNVAEEGFKLFLKKYKDYPAIIQDLTCLLLGKKDD